MSSPDPRQPVSRALRQLIKAHLDSAAEACRRLKNPADAEAVHDFRVALRRLRSLTRAYQPYSHDCLPAKLRRRARDLAASTGLARDTEVQLAWLHSQAEAVGSLERAGYSWMLDRLQARLQEQYESLRKLLPDRLKRLRKRLSAQLNGVCDDDSPPFGRVAADLLLQTGEEFRVHLEQVHDRSDQEEIHRARISAKRLRYLLEPLAAQLDNGKALVKELKRLQEIMGEIHDVQVLAAELSRAAAEVGAAHLQGLIERSLQRSDQVPAAQVAAGCREAPGLVMLAGELRNRQRQLVDRLVASLGSGDLARFLERLEAAAELLRQSALGFNPDAGSSAAIASGRPRDPGAPLGRPEPQP